MPGTTLGAGGNGYKASFHEAARIKEVANLSKIKTPFIIRIGNKLHRENIRS